MRLFILAFVLGDIFLQQFHTLPSAFLILPIVALNFFIYFYLQNNIKNILLGLLSGLAYAILFAHLILLNSFPKNLEGKNITINGVVASIPNIKETNATFLFKIKNSNLNNEISNLLVKLSWHNAPKQKLQVGEQWQFTVRLKHIHSLFNPGSYDYETYAFADHIQAQGYVLSSRFINNKFYSSPIDKIRELIKNKIETILPKTNTSHWIEAISIGERQNIPQEQWEILRNTGTNHLMAIAGLHIGCLATFFYALTYFIWCRIPKACLLFPAQKAASLFAMLIALIYSSLAGFSLPTERASIMVLVALVSLILEKNLVNWFAWSWALFIIVLLNPMSVLSESFWLSFGSVALILYGMSGRLKPKGLWWKYGRMQWIIGIGLIPLSIFLFHQLSFISVIANSIAIPLVGFVIVPLTFVGTILLFPCKKLALIFLMLADKLLNYLWDLLTFFSNLSWSNSYFYTPNPFLIFLACVGIIILLFPKGMPGRLLGMVLLLPLAGYKSVLPADGEFKLIILDVGQGLANIILTRNHLLVFDAGGHMGNMDMGKDVLIPYLQTIQSKKIDMLIVSHGDNDHIGGVDSLSQRFSIITTKTSVPEKLKYLHATTCLRGQHWTWDDVNFEILYPTEEMLGLDNDSSCVLRVSSHTNQVLLTGDIEKKAEEVINSLEGSHLKSAILVAPHHGSKTSGDPEFIGNIRPSYVVYSTGYRNKYHFPHPSIVNLYTKLGVKQYNTVDSGMIIFDIKSNQPVQGPHLYREEVGHYWNSNFR